MLTEVLAAHLEREEDREFGADVVVIGGGSELAREVEVLFEPIPRIAVLAISPNGRQASRYRLVGEQIHLHDPSPQQIVEAIRETRGRDLFEQREDPVP